MPATPSSNTKGAILFVAISALWALAPPAQAQVQQFLADPCPYTNDGDCDEPEGLGLCAEGTDVDDCSDPNSFYGDGPGYGQSIMIEDGLFSPCPYTNDGDCDEPEGLNLCVEGSDVADCANPDAFYGDGPGYQGGGQSTGLLDPCPYTNDGDCDEPEGLGLCVEGSDVADCANPDSFYGDGPGYEGPTDTGGAPETK